MRARRNKRSSDRCPKGQDRGSEPCASGSQNRAGKNAMLAARGQPPLLPSATPLRKNVTKQFFRVALARSSGTVGLLPLKARKRGVETPFNEARSPDLEAG